MYVDSRIPPDDNLNERRHLKYAYHSDTTELYKGDNREYVPIAGILIPPYPIDKIIDSYKTTTFIRNIEALRIPFQETK